MRCLHIGATHFTKRFRMHCVMAGLAAAPLDRGYDDPVDGAQAQGQGIRLHFEGDWRAVLRLSGTGTEGATPQMYLEAALDGPTLFEADPQTVLGPLIAAVDQLVGIERYTGRAAPDVRT